MGVTAVTLAVIYAFVCSYVYLEPTLPTVAAMKNNELSVPLRVYTSSGELIAQIGDQRRNPVKYDQIPLIVRQAFIATEEARASDAYKKCIVECSSDDIVYSNLFTGVHGNYLAPSIRNAGLDPDNLEHSDPTKMSFGSDYGAKKAWKDIWGCGQGIGAVKAVVPVAELVGRLKREYAEARQRLAVA